MDTNDINMGIAELKSQMISKTERKQRTTLASTIADDYNPWQTIRAFKLNDTTSQTNEPQNQTLRNFINKTSDDIETILPQL